MSIYTTTVEHGFAVTHLPGLFYRARGAQGGHTRLFGKVPRGVVIYQYHNGETYGYSNSKCWILPGVVAVCYHDTKGDKLHHCQPAGWSIRWCQFRFRRVYGGFEFTFRSPDTYVS